MMAKVDVRQLHWYAPRVGAATLFATLVICFTVTKARGTYVGGLVWPFFSDMGRDVPTYYVFVAGLSIVAVALSLLWQVNAAFQRRAFTAATPRAYHWAVHLATLLAATSPVGLPLLALYDTANHTMAHAVSTAMFFLLQTMAVILNTAVSYHIYAATRRVHASGSPAVAEKLASRKAHYTSVRRTFLWQATAAALFFVAFIIYVPVGMVIVDKYTRLTIQECLERHLGDHYCTHTVKLNDRDTKLWNYELDFALSQFRALMQLACILTLFAYMASFIAHDFDSVPSSAERASLPRVAVSPATCTVEYVGSPMLHEYTQVRDVKMRTPVDTLASLA